MEFGINIVSPIYIKDLITFLSFHEQHEFINNPEYKYSKQSHSFNKKTGIANNNKIIKAYAKGLQFPEFCDINTFRFEVKSRESAYINKFGIFDLNDLLNVNVYYLLVDKLIEEFKNVLIIYDKIDFTNLNLKEVSKLNTLLSQSHWYRIKQDNKRNVFNDEKIKYYKLIDKTGNHLKKQLEKIIFEKLELLKKGAISTPKENNKKGAISILYNSRIRTQNKTQKAKVKNSICPVTGLNLCYEKEGAKYALTTTLKKLKESDPKTFELVKINLLKKSHGKPKFEQSEIAHLAKQIRNEYYNPFKIKQNGYKQPLNYFQHSQLNFLYTLGI
ncbi:hypothetical protein F6464_05890 [Flavobacterium luteum]|uniref:Uncharacterized protein n=1 Tax=Flavobacterium luteum TaxID=2026654 RepID=A0A7J5AGY6_9FLAO|nr:hypothetical protein F6464_05890 [Flavobacterium luteum]